MQATVTLRNIFIFLVLIFINTSFSFAQVTDSPQTITVDGQLFESGSSSDPLLDSSVVMRVQVLNPAKSCILYEEQHTFSTLATNGRFNIQVGSNVGDLAKRTGLDSANAMTTVFFNRSTAITGKTSGGGGCSYAPATEDVRHFRFFVTPSTVGSTSQLSPDMRVDSVPQALVAQTLQGLGKDDVFKTSVTSTQAKLDNLLTTNYTNITDLIGGTSSMYLRNASTGTLLPTRATDPSTPAAGQLWYDTTSNEIKYYNGTAIQSLGAAGAGISSLTAGSGLSGGTITTSGTISIATGGVTNAMLATGIDASKITAGTLPAGVVPTNTDTTKLPLAGGTMTGAITMGAATTFGGFDLLGTGHITMNGQKTITIGRYDAGQETTLISTLTGANAGATWYNSFTNKLMYWDGGAARELAETSTAGGDITAVNTNAGSGLTGGNTSGPITLAINVDNSTIEVATNTVQVKDAGVTNAKLANNAVTSAKILDGEVTNAKIASMNITKLTNGAGDYFAYMPAGTECATGEVLKWNAASDRWLCDTDATGATDHGALTGVGDDDHTQYVMLAGRSGGQVVRGGTASGDDLTIESTSDATKGDVILQPSGGNVGIGTTIPGSLLSLGNSSGDKLAIYDSGPSFYGLGIAANRMYIKSVNEVATFNNNGNVGIGTTSPNRQLQVYKDSSSSAATFGISNPNVGTGAFSQISVEAAGSLLYNYSMGSGYTTSGRFVQSAGLVEATGSGGLGIAASNASGNLRFYTNNNNEQMRINSSGNVGIGTTAPITGTRLDITGTGATASSIIIPRDTTANRPVTGVNGMLRYNTTLNKFEAYENGAWVNMVNDTGTFTTVTAGTGTAALPSLSFTGESDTGFFNNGADTIGIATGGLHRFDISAAGLVSSTSGGGVVTTANGTATAPTFSFAGDTDTGWFSPAANTLAAATNGTEKIRIDSSGNVGIGTTNPTFALSVEREATAASSDMSTSLSMVANPSASGDMGFDGAFVTSNTKSGNTQNITNWGYVRGAGFSGGHNGTGTVANVIGVGADAQNFSTGTVTTIKGITSYIGNGNSGGTVGSSYGIFVSAPDNWGGGTWNNAYGLYLENQSGVASGNSFNIYSDGGTSKNYFAGSVGIGTTNPAFPLDVIGNMSISGTAIVAGSSGTNFALRRNVDDNVLILSGGNGATTGANFRLHGSTHATAPNVLTINNSGSEAMRVSASGNVGIGTTAPVLKLDVSGDMALAANRTNSTIKTGKVVVPHYDNTRADVGLIQMASKSIDNEMIIGSGNGTTGATGISFYTHTNNWQTVSGAVRMFINSTGNVGIGTTNPVVALDFNTRTDGVRLPQGTTAQQPTGANGIIRYNTTTNKFEGYENGAWVNLRDPASNTSVSVATGSAAAPALSFTGEADTGFYNSGTNSIGVATSGALLFDFNTVGLVSPTVGGANILSGNGTAATPTYGFAGDTDTGWFRPAADTMAASTAGSEKMRITSAGSVGIGTTNPLAKLAIESGNVLVQGENNYFGYTANVYSAAHTPFVVLDHYRGTIASPSYLQSGDAIGEYALRSQILLPDGGASLLGVATQNHSAAAGGSALAFYTTTNDQIIKNEKVRIDHNGNVGIGTTSPQAKFEVVDSGIRSAINPNSILGSTVLGSITNHDTTIISNNFQNLIVKANGNVGIGTTSPLRRFVVQGAAITNAAHRTISVNEPTAGNESISMGYDANGTIHTAGFLRTNNNLPLSLGTLTNPTAMTILDGGNVGIGTTNPGSVKLAVSGDNTNIPVIVTANTLAGGYAGYRMQNTTQDWELYTGAGTSAFALKDNTNTKFPFAVESNAPDHSIRVLSSGNVGIGSVNPGVKLHVAGNVAANNFVGGVSTTNFQLGFYSDDSFANGWQAFGAASGTPNTLSAITSGTEKFRITSTGNIGIGTSSPSYKLDVQGGDINASGSVRAAGVALTSDLRYKRDIETIDDALEKLLNIRGVSYQWRTDEFPHKQFNDRAQIGVIAQEVERQFPQVVDTDELGYKSVNYPALVAPLIEAVKSIYKRIVGVEAKQVEQARVLASKANKTDVEALLKAKDQEIQKLKQENADTKARLDKIEKMLKSK